MKKALSKSQMIGLLLVALLAPGCNTASNLVLGSRIVNVSANEDICKKSVEVHLVGVNRFEKELWETMSMTEYWEPENRMRKSARDYTYVIQFGHEPCDRLLAKKDNIRNIWKNRKAEYLFVLADIPGIFVDGTGNADERRLCLPSPGSSCWGIRQRTINIKIESANVVALTIPKSKDCD